MKRVSLTAALLALLAAHLASAAPLRIRGRVTDPTGKPLPTGLRAELLSAVETHADGLARLGLAGSSQPLAAAAARPDGSFELTAPGPGCYRVVLRGEGLVALEAFLVPLVEDTELPVAAPPPAEPLAVTILDPGGRPAPGVAVHAFREGASGREDGAPVVWSPAERRAVTGPDGRATLPRGRREVVGLMVASPSYAGTSRSGISGAQATLRLERRPAVALEVRGPGGHVVPRALVRLGAPPWAPLGLTGEDGRLAVATMAGGALPLLVEGPSGGLAEVELPAAAPGAGGKAAAQAPVLRVDLRPAQALAGRVLDAASGAPLPGAVVWSEPFPSDPFTVAGPDGRFRLPYHPSRRLALAAGAAAHLPARAEAARDGRPAGDVLRLLPAAEIAGRVVDGKGKPVAGARVRAALTSWRPGLPEGSSESTASSSPDGRFRVQGLMAGEAYRIVASHEGYASASAAATAAPPGRGEALRLALSAGATASGSVADAAGAPVAGAEVVLGPAADSWSPGDGVPPEPRRARSDAAGRFALPHLRPGGYRLQVEAPGFAASRREGIEVPRGVGRLDLGVVTLEAGAVIEGRVVDARGAPVEGARVQGFGILQAGFPGRFDSQPEPAVTTGADGRFRVADLKPGDRFDLQVWHPDHPPVRVPGVEAPTAAPLTVELADGGTLTGRVVGPDGEPVAEAGLMKVERAAVKLGSDDSMSVSGSTLGSADAAGRFRISNLAAGPLEMVVSGGGYLSRRLRGIAVQAGRELDLGDVRLERGTAIEGQVSDADGRPVPGAAVSASRRTEPGELPIFDRIEPRRTDEEGRFRLQGLRPGTYEVEATGLAGEQAVATVEARAGTVRVSLAFPRGAEVAGRVVDQEGAPLGGSALTLVPNGRGNALAAASGADGSFRFPAVPPGDYRLLAGREGYEPAEWRVQVEEQPLGGLELRLERAGTESGEVAGRLLELSEAEQRRVQIVARGLRVRVGAPDGRGGYRIADLAPGDWQVEALAPGGRRAGGTVRIEPGAGTVELDLEFPSDGLILSGRVTVDRRALAGASVSLASQGGGSSPTTQALPRHTTTGYDGRFELRGVPAGAYTLLVALVGSGAGQIRTVTLDSDLDLAIDLETGRLQGQVVSAVTGEPVAGAALELELRDEHLGASFSGPTAASDEAGAFAVAGLAPGSYVIKATAPGFEPAKAHAQVEAGAQAAVEVRLRPRSR